MTRSRDPSRPPPIPPSRPPPTPGSRPPPIPRPRAERFDARLSADVTYRGKVVTTRTRNLSEGGVCIEAPRALPEGAQLLVALFLVLEDVEDSATPPLQVRGTVAWCTPELKDRPAAMGIRFDEIAAHQLNRLRRFLGLLREGR